MSRYALRIMGMKKPIYFDTKVERNKFVSKIKGIFIYSTFTVETYKGKCPDCKKQLQLGEMEVNGKIEKIAQCNDCKYWEIITALTFEQVYKKYDGKYGDLVEAYVKLANSEVLD